MGKSRQERKEAKQRKKEEKEAFKNAMGDLPQPIQPEGLPPPFPPEQQPELDSDISEFEDLEESKPKETDKIDMFDISQVLNGVKSHMEILKQKIKDNSLKEENLLLSLKNFHTEVLDINQELKQMLEITNPIIQSLEDKHNK